MVLPPSNILVHSGMKNDLKSHLNFHDFLIYFILTLWKIEANFDKVLYKSDVARTNVRTITIFYEAQHYVGACSTASTDSYWLAVRISRYHHSSQPWALRPTKKFFGDFCCLKMRLFAVLDRGRPLWKVHFSYKLPEIGISVCEIFSYSDAFSFVRQIFEAKHGSAHNNTTNCFLYDWPLCSRFYNDHIQM